MPDDYFIENIDYAETQGYVKKVLRNYACTKNCTPPPPDPRGGGATIVQTLPWWEMQWKVLYAAL